MKNNDLYPTPIQATVINIFYRGGYSKPVFKTEYVAVMTKLVGPSSIREIKINSEGRVIEQKTGKITTTS